jgi:hypothetical protein
MKMSVQLEVTEMWPETNPITKDDVVRFLNKHLCSAPFFESSLRIDSIRLITGARPIVKEPDAITPH